MPHEPKAVDPSVVRTRYWHATADGRIQCDCCPRECRLGEGQRGFCFVRAASGGQVVLTSYGRSSGLCVDPIEKKPLNHFLPGTAVLSFGTAGCNLGCRFCQNWEMSRSRRTETLAVAASPAAIAATAQSLGCRSVAFTYNEPVVFMEYAIDVADACHELGIAAVAVSAGYMNPAPRAEFYRHIDAVNIDLKGFDPAFYRSVALGELPVVLETLEYLATTGVHLEITTLLVPGHNDDEAQLSAQCAWIAEHLGCEVPLHFTAFHPDHRMRQVPPTPPRTLAMARRIATDHGLRHVYQGNLRDGHGQSTSCRGCGAVVIERDGYTIGRYLLTDDGCCRRCGTRLPGHFDGPVGQWGQRRMPVRVLAEPAGGASGRDRVDEPSDSGTSTS